MELSQKEIALLKEVFAIASAELDRRLKECTYLSDDAKVELVNKYASVNSLCLKVYAEYNK